MKVFPSCREVFDSLPSGKYMIIAFGNDGIYNRFIPISFMCVYIYIQYIYTYIYNIIYIYKGLRILSRYCSCQDSEFRSAMETSSVDKDKLLSK